MSLAIKAEGLSKEYRLGSINHGMLYKDIQSWLARSFGHPDPHARIDDDRTRQHGDRFWALKDVSFEVEQGDRVGIVGRNGAGKSTLLKILSRITAPTEGVVKVRGRMASLLEVGTGFHPELTGRENVFLNGATLGMTKREIESKFDEIVEFSEIEQFIDTPVKRYSSGMYVRLAFAVAAHLDSDILLADEVLAVGDAAFQKKCLGKMEDVSKKDGRTVLFVSHNLSAINALCTKGIYLSDGRIAMSGDIGDVLKSYFALQKAPRFENMGKSGSEPSIRRIWLEDADGKPLSTYIAGSDYTILVEIENPAGEDLELRLWTSDDMNRPLWAFTNGMYGIKPIAKPGCSLVKLGISQPATTGNEISFDFLLRRYQSNKEYTHVETVAIPVIDAPEYARLTKYTNWPIYVPVVYTEK